MYRVALENVRVPEKCATHYKVGDKIVFEDPKIVLSEITNLCLYVLCSLTLYLTPLSRDLPKEDWMNMVSELSYQDQGVKFRVTRIRCQPKHEP